MPRNSQGQYTLPAGNPVAPNTTITAAWANAVLADVAVELANSLDRSGRGGMLAPFKNADGVLASPGITFVNEPSLGIARLNGGEMQFIAGGAARMKISNGSVDFPVIPTTSVAPSAANHLINRTYGDANYHNSFTISRVYSPLTAVGGLCRDGSEADVFVVDTDKVLSHYGITWKTFTDSPGGASLAVSGYGGIKMYVGGNRAFNMGPAGDLVLGLNVAAETFGLTIRGDAPDGARITLSNKSINGALHKFGEILWDAYRDVASPSFVAGMWAEGTSAAGNTVRLVWGLTQNGVNAYPTERMSLDVNGTVTAVNFTALGGQFISSIPEGLRVHSDAGYISVWNNAGTIRSGYMQLNSSGSWVFGGEGVSSNFSFSTAGTARFTISNTGVLSDAIAELGWKNIVVSGTASGVLTAAERGKGLSLNAGVTINIGVFPAGSAVLLFNNTAGGLVITQGGGMTLRGTSTGADGSKTIPAWGQTMLWFITSSFATVSGL